MYKTIQNSAYIRLYCKLAPCILPSLYQRYLPHYFSHTKNREPVWPVGLSRCSSYALSDVTLAFRVDDELLPSVYLSSVPTR